MGLLSKLLRRGDAVVDSGFKEHFALATAQGEAMKGDTETEVAWKENLAFKYEAIHDEDVEAVLAHKCLVPQLTPKLNEDGTVEYARDANGNVLTDANGNPIISYKQTYTVDNTFAALRTAISHVNRLVFLQPKNSRLVSLYMEDIVETAKLSMKESQFDLGLGSYLDALWVYDFMLINDAENGNKLKTMFEISKKQRIEFAPEEKQHKRGIF